MTIILHMVRNGHNVPIYIRCEMVIMYRSTYGTKWSWCGNLHMVRNGHNVPIYVWYEMVMMQLFAYGTKWS